MQQFYGTFLVILVWFGMDRNADHGTSALWISLEGCYRNVSVLTSRDLSKTNGPRGCFRECPTSPFIGLQENMCFCIAKHGDQVTISQCNLQCEGEIDMLCGSDSGMSLFSRVTPQPNISVNGDIGFAYVHLSHRRNGIGYDTEFNATSDTSEQHNYICYAGFLAGCTFFDSAADQKTWQHASRSCQDRNQDLVTLQSLSNVSSCSDPGQVKVPVFWIGMIWIKPASSTLTTISPSTSSTQSLSLSKSTSTSTSTSTSRSTSTSTSTSPSTPTQTSTSTNISKPGQDSTTLSTGKASEGSPRDGINVVYEITTVPGKMEKMEKIDADVNSDYLSVKVAVPIVCAFLLAVAFVTCWKKEYLCFKPDQERKQDGAGRNGEDEIDSIAVDESIHSSKGDIQIANTPNDLGDRGVRPGQSHDESEAAREKRRIKRERKERRKQESTFDFPPETPVPGEHIGVGNGRLNSGSITNMKSETSHDENEAAREKRRIKRERKERRKQESMFDFPPETPVPGEHIGVGNGRLNSGSITNMKSETSHDENEAAREKRRIKRERKKRRKEKKETETSISERNITTASGIRVKIQEEH